jgi:phage gp16-like protein
MSKEELTKYRESFINKMKVYPRAIFFEMRNNGFEVAKKFFGEEVYRKRSHVYQNMTIHDDVLFWHYHMAKMVLCEDELEYLRKFTEENK